MSRFLKAFEAEVRKKKANMYAVAEYCDGALETVQIHKANPCQDTYSVAKVFVVTAIGLLVDRGLLSTEEIVTEILSGECPADYQPIWDHVTVDMLLLHKVPLPKYYLDIDSSDTAAFGEDYLAYVLRTATVTDPAKLVPCYTDAAYYLLSRIVEKRSGMGTDNFLWKHLFYPMGCREAAWSHCPMGHVMGATGLYIRVEDVAKLGAIYLNGGVWQGKRILSEEWVDLVFRKGYELKPQLNGFAKGGMRGQLLLVVPSRKQVIAYLGCENYSFEQFLSDFA